MTEPSKNSLINIDNLYFWGDSPKQVRWLNPSRLNAYTPKKPFSIIDENNKIHFDQNAKLHGDIIMKNQDIHLEMTINHSLIVSLKINGKDII